jgi:hypothetical protein
MMSRRDVLATTSAAGVVTAAATAAAVAPEKTAVSFGTIRHDAFKTRLDASGDAI